MSVQVFMCRLFGGRDIGVSYDNVGQSISIMGQSIAISSLPAALQAQWQAAAISGASSTNSRPAFGGDNISASVGGILDNQPAWRSAIQTALAAFLQATVNNANPDVQSWNR